jgi:hypothetical protein
MGQSFEVKACVLLRDKAIARASSAVKRREQRLCPHIQATAVFSVFLCFDCNLGGRATNFMPDGMRSGTIWGEKQVERRKAKGESEDTPHGVIQNQKSEN